MRNPELKLKTLELDKVEKGVLAIEEQPVEVLGVTLPEPGSESKGDGKCFKLIATIRVRSHGPRTRDEFLIKS